MQKILRRINVSSASIYGERLANDDVVMPPKQTKRAALPTRYFAGKPVGKEEVDDFSSSDEDQPDQSQAVSKNEQRTTTNPILALKNVNLDEKFEREKKLEQERVALIEEADALVDEEQDEESDEEVVRLPKVEQFDADYTVGGIYI